MLIQFISRIVLWCMLKSLFSSINSRSAKTVDHFFCAAFRDTTQKGTSTTKLVDDMTDRTEGQEHFNNIAIQWFDEVSSTMDKAKEVIRNDTGREDPFIVVTDIQTNGRGTRGRSWKYGTGNLFMTICLHRNNLVIPFQYLPLRVGTLIGSALHPYLTSESSTMKLKWPNDVLINGHKVCGVLIEMEDDFFLIGIGCNVVTKPEVSPDGPDGGRTPTALIEHSSIIEEMQQSFTSCDTNQQCAVQPNRRVAMDIASRFSAWMTSGNDSPQQVIDDFSANMDFSEQVLRDKQNLPTGRVQPLRLNADGTLKVKQLVDGAELDLVADYLY